MNKILAFALAGLAVFVGLVLTVGLTWMSANNREVSLRNAITAKQHANQAAFDNMWKQIKSAAEVTDAQKNALKEIFVEHAQARSGAGSDKAIVKWLQESVPNVDTTVFTNLQNIIVGTRNSFTSDQVALLDLKREHDNVLTTFPSSFFVGGRPHIDVQIVTSERTEKTFATGKDDDVNVFSK